MFRRLVTGCVLTALLAGTACGAAEEHAPASPNLQGAINLQGLVSEYAGPPPDVLLERLVTTAVEQDADQQHLKRKDKEFNGVVRKAIVQTKLVAQVMTEYRGFEISSEAADVILDEKTRLKSRAAIDYAKQKRLDDAHTKISESLMQIAQGLGEADEERRAASIEEGMKPLRELVGKDNAEQALSAMTGWAAQVHVPDVIFKQRTWGVMEQQKKTEDLVKASLQDDPVMSYIRRSLHKYNSHSKLALAGAKVVNTTLSVAMFSPSVISPAAQLLLIAYLAATGGPEDSKLLKELYLDRRLESRWKRMNQEATQAVNSYSTAVLTGNSVLLAYSENIMSRLGGEESTSKMIGADKLVSRKSSRDSEIYCPQTHDKALK